MAQRKHHGGAFKARVAIEAIAGHKTVRIDDEEVSFKVAKGPADFAQRDLQLLGIRNGMVG
jgi:hypothetical protein